MNTKHPTKNPVAISGTPEGRADPAPYVIPGLLLLCNNIYFFNLFKIHFFNFIFQGQFSVDVHHVQ